MPPPFLNFDIQVEILKRLPVKSLIRFRSVCKAWKSLIDTSRFIADHNNVHHDQSDEHLMISYEVENGTKREEKYVCYVDDDTFPQNPFSPRVPSIFRILNGCEIIDSSCGLVCLKGYLRKPDKSVMCMVVLWNPSVRKSISIVVPNDNSPSWLSPFVGFGVCPKTNDPKLVKISYNDDDHCTCRQVMVFTLTTRKWRCLSGNHFPRKALGNSRQTVIGRFLYRVAFDGELFFISSFDLRTNEFGEVPLPDGLRPSGLSVSKLRESLVLIGYKGRDSTTDDIDGFHVWMMDGGGGGAFTKLFTIKNKSVVRILGFKKNGEPLVEIEILDDDSDQTPLLAVYEPYLDRIKHLGICRDVNYFSMCSYNESLLLLDQDDGCIVRAVEEN